MPLVDLQTLIDSKIDLPPAPQILPKLQKVVNDEDSSIFDIIDLIKVDASLTTQIIRLSNSAYFGVLEPSNSLEEAITRVGFSQTYKVVTSAVAQQVLGDSLKYYGLGEGELLERSFATAIAMTEMSMSSRLHFYPDTLYTLGLLHNLGKVIVNQYFMKRGIEIYEADNESAVTPEEERKLLGFDHAEVAAAVMEKWKFGQEIVEPIRFQLNPEEASEHQKIASLLVVARNLVPTVFDEEKNPTEELSSVNTYVAEAGLENEDFANIRDRTAESLVEVRNMLGGG